jgi:hypothetical protein
MLVVKAFVLAFFVFQLIIALHADLGVDAAAYQHAAERLRDGQPLYLSPDPDAPDAYRYSPWLAFAWVPLTFFPTTLVYLCWTVLLLIATAWVGWRVWRLGLAGRLLALLVVPLLIDTSIVGNVQPLVVAALIVAGTRYGPFALAIAASWKLVPILGITVYLGRREWRKAAVALVLTGILWAPILLTGLDGCPTVSAGRELAPVAILLAASMGLSFAAVNFARRRYGWMLAGLAMVIALPRLHGYNATFLLTGISASPSDGRQRDRNVA